MAYTNLFPVINSSAEITLEVGAPIYSFETDYLYSGAEGAIVNNGFTFDLGPIDVLSYGFLRLDNGVVVGTEYSAGTGGTQGSLSGYYNGPAFQLYGNPDISNPSSGDYDFTVFRASNAVPVPDLKTISINTVTDIFGASFGPVIMAPTGVVSTSEMVILIPCDDGANNFTFYQATIDFDAETIDLETGFITEGLSGGISNAATFLNKAGDNYVAYGGISAGMIISKATPAIFSDPFTYVNYKVNIPGFSNSDLGDGFVIGQDDNSFFYLYVDFTAEVTYLFTVAFDGSSASIIKAYTGVNTGFIYMSRDLAGNLVYWANDGATIYSVSTISQNLTKILSPLALPCANPCIPFLRRK